MNLKLITFTLTVIFSVILTLSILFLFSSQIEAIEETLEKQLLHPCQKTAIDYFEMYKENANLLMSSGLSKEDRINWGEEFNKRDQMIKQSLIDNNCENTMHEWATEEFKASYRMLLEKGF